MVNYLLKLFNLTMLIFCNHITDDLMLVQEECYQCFVGINCFSQFVCNVCIYWSDFLVSYFEVKGYVISMVCICQAL